jgi:transcriptional regulator with XRE-family HTH domain
MSYRTYNWKNKNPVIDKVRTILQDEGLYSKKRRATLHQLTGVSVTTYDGWFEGETRDPKHTTIMATLSALGYEEKFVKETTVDIDKELAAAAAWRERQEREREKFNAKPNGKNKPKKAKT